MKTINKNELYEHLGDFLKSKGIELREGAYAKRIQQGCDLLSEVVNAGHSGLQRARVKAAKKLDQMRQLIHEKTAPKPPPVATSPAKPSVGAKPPASKVSRRKPARRRALSKARRA